MRVELFARGAGVIPSRRSPGGAKDGEESPAIGRWSNLCGGSFAALRRSAAAPAQDDRQP